MAQNISNQDMRLNLSTDNAKPRPKWTGLLHQRFSDAAAQLGGAEATPKSWMSIHGIQSYHLKSYMQKFSQGKQQLSETYNDDYLKDYSENLRYHFRDETQNCLNENLQVSPAQRELQRQLKEQIKVHQHLQLRTEAQGKYLESVLKRAQDILGSYSNGTSQSSCPLSKTPSCESTARKEESRNSNAYNESKKKRSGSTISDGSCVEQSPCKRAKIDLSCGEFRALENTDLNNHNVSELDSPPNPIT